MCVHDYAEEEQLKRKVYEGCEVESIKPNKQRKEKKRKQPYSVRCVSDQTREVYLRNTAKAWKSNWKKRCEGRYSKTKKNKTHSHDSNQNVWKAAGFVVHFKGSHQKTVYFTYTRSSRQRKRAHTHISVTTCPGWYETDEWRKIFLWRAALLHDSSCFWGVRGSNRRSSTVQTTRPKNRFQP